jgi:hypothetical protein
MEEEIAALKEQIKGLVESQRNDLMGKWDDARIWLDAVDPNNAGKWANQPYPPKE